MSSDPRIIVTVTKETYVFTTEHIPSDDTILYDGSEEKAVLCAVGAPTVTLTATPSNPQPFSSMVATTKGSWVYLSNGQKNGKGVVLAPFALSVDGLSGTPLVIVPQFKLMLGADPEPSIEVGEGASVLLTAGVGSTITTTSSGAGVNLFVGETKDSISMAKSPEAFTIASGTGGNSGVDYALTESTPKTKPEPVPLKGGKIRVSPPGSR